MNENEPALRIAAERAEALAALDEIERGELRALFLDEVAESRTHETLRRENAFIARLAERYGGLTAQRVRGALWERVAEEKRRSVGNGVE